MYKQGKKLENKVYGPEKDKRYRVRLNGRYKQVSRLVALTYIPNPNIYPYVLHLDNNPLNNYYKNLIWGSHQMNMDQIVKEGRWNCNGGRCKLSTKDVKDIRQSKLPQIELAKIYGVSQGQISGIRNFKCRIKQG